MKRSNNSQDNHSNTAESETNFDSHVIYKFNFGRLALKGVNLLKQTPDQVEY